VSASRWRSAGERLEAGLGGEHAGLDRGVAPLMRAALRKPASSPISAPPGKISRGQALQAAGGDGARAVGQALAALEELADSGWVLKRCIPRRATGGVLVVEADHEAERDQVVLEVVDEAAAVGVGVHRPAGGVHDQAGTMHLGLDLPQLLDADAVGLRVDAVAQLELRLELLAEVAAAAFGEQVYLACSSMPAGGAGRGCRRG
jgi:hypothetical protein